VQAESELSSYATRGFEFFPRFVSAASASDSLSESEKLQRETGGSLVLNGSQSKSPADTITGVLVSELINADLS
jgi:hypothetical protein